MAKKIVAFSIEIEGKKEIKQVTELFGLLEKQLKAVNKELIELNKTASNFGGKALKETEKQLDKTGMSAKRLSGFFQKSVESFEQGNKVVRDLGNGYFEVTKAIDNSSKEIKENANSISALIARNKELKKALQDAEQGVESINFQGQTVEVSKLTKEFAANNDAIKNFRKELRTGTKQQDVAKGSILDLRKRVSDLKKEYLALTPAQRNALIGPGAKIRKELIATTKELKKQEERIGDFRRSVGNYEKSLGRVGRAALKVFGIRGAFEGLRRIGQGLADLVQRGSETNETFAKIQTATSGLSNVATNLGTSILNTFGGTITKVIENFSFIIFKIGEGFKAAAESGGITGKILTFVGDILRDFPAIWSGVIAVVGEAFAKIGRGFDNASLKAQQLFLNIRRVASAITGEDVENIDNQLRNIGERLEENAAAAVSFSDAFRRGFEQSKKEQEEFIKRNNEETAAREKEAEAIKRQEEARTAAAAARKKAQQEEAARLEKLASDRQQLREQLVQEELTRLQLIKQLGEELIDAQIENEKDLLKAREDAENERFRRAQKRRKENLKNVEKDLNDQRNEIIRLFGKESQELIDFDKKAGQDLKNVRDLNRQIEEQAAIKHQENLTQIQKDGQQQRIQGAKTGFSNLSGALGKAFEVVAKTSKDAIDKANETTKQQVEETKKQAEAIASGLQDILGSVFDGINLALERSAEAENERFERSLEERQNNIDNLNEDLENATGLQKKFLEQQVENERRAQAEIERQAEQARKKQAEAQKAVAIVQAIIQTALAVTQALGSSPPPASFILAAAAGAAGAVQIATIASQRFAEGGLVGANAPANVGNGKITTGSNIKTQPNGDNILATVKRGEVILNERQQSLLGGSQTFASIGVPGFANGGFLGAPIAPPVAPAQNQAQSNFDTLVTAFNEQTTAINNRIDRIQVVNSVDDFNEVSENDATLDAESTL